MTIKQLQHDIDHWIQTVGVRYFTELTNAAILSEEVGEVNRLMARIYGEQSFKQPTTSDQAQQMLADELADVIWVVTCIANQTGIDLTQAIEQNLDKKRIRDKERHKSNSKLI